MDAQNISIRDVWTAGSLYGGVRNIYTINDIGRILQEGQTGAF
jgi:hypothetical protein